MSEMKDEDKIKALEGELAIMRERYRILAEATQALLFEYLPSEDTMVYYYHFPNNHKTWKVTNYREFTLEENLIHPSHIKNVLKVLHKAANRPLKGEMEYLSKISGETYEWHRTYYSSIVDEKGKVITVVGRIQNIHESVAQRHTLMHRMETDALTGLYNRETILEKAQKWLDENPTTEAYIIMVAVDDMNTINKIYGHAMGENVLKQTARVLRNYFEDMSIPARYSGAEFMVFAMEETLDMLEVRVDAFIKYLTSTIKTEDQPITCSIGIAGRSSAQDGFEDMFSRASSAMYQAEQLGKNHYCIYQN